MSHFLDEKVICVVVGLSISFPLNFEKTCRILILFKEVRKSDKGLHSFTQSQF